MAVLAILAIVGPTIGYFIGHALGYAKGRRVARREREGVVELSG